MVASIVDLDFIRSLTGKDLTAVQRVRAQLDIDAVTGTLERWLNRKLVETTILNERHVGLAELEPIAFRWRPVKQLLGIRFDLVTNDLVDTYNDRYSDQIIYRDDVYYVSYVTDASEIVEYMADLKRIISNVVINGLLKSDPVRYGVINSYNVEGLSISYNSGGSITDPKAVGPIPGTDLVSLSNLRNMVIA